MAENLRVFQQAFARHLRDPEQDALPEGIPASRAKIYQDLLFNNVCGFINTCFPVCKSIIASEMWQLLLRGFFRDWRAHSPYFHEIPREFLSYLEALMDGSVGGRVGRGGGESTEGSLANTLPAFIQELAHYEWVELEADTAAATVPQPNEVRLTLDSVIYANPVLYVLAYRWPVHQICDEFQPNEGDLAQPTYIAVYRNVNHKVEFVELNPATAHLLQLIQAGPLTVEQLVAEMAAAMPQFSSEQLGSFILEIIQQFIQQNILYARSET